MLARFDSNLEVNYLKYYLEYYFVDLKNNFAAVICRNIATVSKNTFLGFILLIQSKAKSKKAEKEIQFVC
jgi:hypothetical protein